MALYPKPQTKDIVRLWLRLKTNTKDRWTEDGYWDADTKKWVIVSGSQHSNNFTRFLAPRTWEVYNWSFTLYDCYNLEEIATLPWCIVNR